MRYHAPLDPECPVVEKYMRELFDDPMTASVGDVVDDIIEHFEIKHRKSCQRCQEFGAANIEIQERN